ncbi:TPA: hypothetical protein HA278_04395 [Candidatus Woesearchaeota archaeon]|jgi:hypothetical protein|nr:hypothetical protein [archaeon]HIJ11271.1 hypothetical protein [Candidatus Woesearchaeota archaeon]
MSYGTGSYDGFWEALFAVLLLIGVALLVYIVTFIVTALYLQKNAKKEKHKALVPFVNVRFFQKKSPTLWIMLILYNLCWVILLIYLFLHVVQIGSTIFIVLETIITV